MVMLHVCIHVSKVTDHVSWHVQNLRGGGGRGLFLIIGGNQEKNPYKRFDLGRMLELIYKSLYGYNVKKRRKKKKKKEEVLIDDGYTLQGWSALQIPFNG